MQNFPIVHYLGRFCLNANDSESMQHILSATLKISSCVKFRLQLYLNSSTFVTNNSTQSVKNPRALNSAVNCPHKLSFYQPPLAQNTLKNMCRKILKLKWWTDEFIKINFIVICCSCCAPKVVVYMRTKRCVARGRNWMEWKKKTSTLAHISTFSEVLLDGRSGRRARQGGKQERTASVE